MEEPDLYEDESVLLSTPDVFVKSVPFEAILTNKRIIFIDRIENLIPQKDVAVAAIRAVDVGENAIRDPTLTIAVVSSGGETRQMVLTFPQKTGAVRKRERDAWAKELRALTATSVQKVIRKVIPVIEREPRRTTAGQSPTAGRGERADQYMAEEAEEEPVPPERATRARQAVPAGTSDDPLPYGSFCTKCGNRLSSGSAFCSRCGSRVIMAQEKVQPVKPDEPEEPEVPEEPVLPRASRPVRATSRANVAQPLRKTEPERLSGRAQYLEEEQQCPEPKTGLLSRLFLGKKARKKEVPPPDDYTPGPAAKRASSGLPKKILPFIAIAAVILIVAAIAVFILPIVLSSIPSSGNETTPDDHGPAVTTVTTTSASSVPTTAVSVRTTVPITIPSSGIYIKVSYIGAWKGTYGIGGYDKTISRSGTVLLEVDGTSGTVEATFQKDDTSTKSHELLVEIYKNGNLLKSGSTTDYQGKVSVSTVV